MQSITKRFGVLGTFLIAGTVFFASAAFANIVAGNPTTGISAHVTYTQISLDKPVVAVGDLMLASLAIEDGSLVNVTAPSGWTQIARTDNDVNVALISYFKVANSSEPNTYTWTIDEQTKAVGGIIPYTGVDTVNPVDSVAGNTGFGIVATTSSITTSVQNAQIISLFATDVNKSFSLPTGMTQKYSLAHAAGPFIAAFETLQATTGVVASKSSTISGNKSRNWASQQIALRPLPENGLQNGLASYWKFDESSGNAADATSNGNTLTNNNSATFTTGKINNAAFLDRSLTQYFSIIDSAQTGLDITGDMTINAWIKLPSVLTSDIYGFVSKCDNESRGWCTLINNNGESDQFSFWASDDGSNSSGTTVNFSSTFAANTWYMVTLIYHSAAGTFDVYRDGSHQGTGTGLPNSIYNGTAEFRVGWDNNPSSTDGFNGVMDEVGIWSRALSATEVSALYNSGAGLPFSSF